MVVTSIYGGSSPAQIASHLHAQWGLQCCTVTELREWLESSFGALSMSRESFCGDALPASCRVDRRLGRCVACIRVN